MPDTPTLATLAADLDSGATSARKLVEECLARIADPAGEGQRTFIRVDREAALEAAEAMDRLRKAHAAPSPYAGIPVSIKDLFDIKGQVTRAGSRALEENCTPAEADAPVVARLRRAGFIVIGRTNMTEFAYSGIGINPHYGTPKSVWNRSVGHVPGGSSSGAAVSVADRMAHGALGTDTGGSCRIPAAYNGIVGFKPTPCSPMRPCSRCSRARSRACGSRSRPRSRLMTSTKRSRKPLSARWRRCHAVARRSSGSRCLNFTTSGS
jgi:aspartyl-tRNA(Asn)/glutamyl-tRNA(Gln) amidotransferase subunit A